LPTSSTEFTNEMVSVIVTTKNSSRTIGKCLESIKAQSYNKIETFVIDGMSSDNTCEISSKLGAKVFPFEGERTKAKNFGITQSKGYFLFFVDSDMALDKDVVAECVKICLEDKKAGAVIIPEHSVGSSFWVKVRDFERQMYAGTKIESARFFRKELVSKVCGFDEEIISFEESIVPQKIGELGYKIDLRIKSYIFHNEEEFNLSKWLTKKKYYYSTARHYSKKYNRYYKLQFNEAHRIKIFVANGNWKVLIKHPGLTLGLIALKSMEFFVSRRSNLFK